MAAARRVADDTTPTFSILTAAYNSAGTVAETIESVLAQDRGDWELIIVDDGSTDDTLAVVERTAGGDPRVRALSQTNAGAAAARNTAAAAAQGAYFCILDADDAYESDYLSAMHDLIERYPDRDLYSCNATYLYPNGLRVPVWRGAAFSREREYTLHEMLDRNLVFIMATMRREAFERVGGFIRRWFVEDYGMWLRILMSGGRHIYTPRTLGIYRLTPGSLATQRDNLENSRLELLGQLAEEYPGIDRTTMQWAIARQQRRVEVAELEGRIVEGDFRDARRTYIRNLDALPTLTRKVLGGVTMALHPALYRSVFLGRMVETRRRKAAG